MKPLNRLRPRAASDGFVTFGPMPVPPTPVGELRRSFIAVCSAKHSPGVTTLALALAASPPGVDSVLVDADPAGGDLAIWLGGTVQAGLLGLLGKAHRGLTAEAVLEQCQLLALGPALLASPTDLRETEAALNVLASRLSGILGETARRCVCDCGRLWPGSPSLPFAMAADSVIWAMRPDKAALEHTRTRLEALPELRDKSFVVLVGRSARARDRDELASFLPVPVIGTLPPGAGAIELLVTGSRRWEQTAYGLSVSGVLHQVTRQSRHQRTTSSAPGAER